MGALPACARSAILVVATAFTPACFTDAVARYATNADSLHSVETATRYADGELVLSIDAALGGEVGAHHYTVRVPKEALAAQPLPCDALLPRPPLPQSANPEWNPERVVLAHSVVKAGWPADREAPADGASQIAIAKFPDRTLFTRTGLSALRPPRGSTQAVFYERPGILLTGWSSADLAFVVVDEEPVFAGHTYRVFTVRRPPSSGHMVWPVLLMPFTLVLDALTVAFMAAGAA